MILTVSLSLFYAIRSSLSLVYIPYVTLKHSNSLGLIFILS